MAPASRPLPGDGTGRSPDRTGQQPDGQERPATAGPLPPAVSAALGGEPTLVERLSLVRKFTPPRPRYTLLGEIGAGSMGRVLRVWDEVLGRELAMKVIDVRPPEGVSEEERVDHERRVARFVEEASTTGRLHHPSIVPVHEIGLDESEHLYFTMPLVQGHTLSDVFRFVRTGEDGWNLHRALEVMRQVCMTVAYAHSEGVVHRDLKPDNVMVGKFDEVYVLDWGLALIAGLKRGRSIVGTPGYMAPEQSKAPQEVGPLADVYSLGAILYQLLGQSVPHQRTMEETPGQLTIDALVQSPPRPLRALAPDAPYELVAICDKAMEARPERRYPSAKALGDDLRAWLEGRVVQAYDTGPLARVRKWHVRHRGMAWALDVLTILTVVSVAVVFVLKQRHLNEVEAANARILEKTYSANLQAANTSLRTRDLTDARYRLANCPEELRGWEWRHLDFLSDASRLVLGHHDAEVRAVDVDPRGELVATAAGDGALRLWDARDGSLALVLDGAPERAALAVRFAPGGGRLATGGEDERVRLWDLSTGLAARELAGHRSRVLALAFSPDGRRLAAAEHDQRVLVHDLDEGAPPVVLEREGEYGTKPLAFDPATGHLFVGWPSGRIACFDVDARSVLHERGVLGGSVLALAVTPDGERVFAAVGAEVLELDRELAARADPRPHVELVTALDVDARGERLLAGTSDGALRVWSLASPSEVTTYFGHAKDVTSVRFAPDGERFVSGSEDDTARLWLAHASAVDVLGGHGGWVTSLAYTDDGRRLVTGARDGALRVWDAERGELAQTIPTGRGVDAVAWTPAGHIVFGNAVFEGAGSSPRDPWLRVVDPGLAAASDSGARWAYLRGGDLSPTAVAVDSASRRVAALYVGGALHVWEDEAPEPVLTARGFEDATSLAFVPGGEALATGSRDGLVRLDATRNGVELARFDADDPINCLAFSRDGELLVAGTRNSWIVVWAVDSGRELARLRGHENQVTAIDFSPDGTRVASGSLDRTLAIWSVAARERLLTLRGHEGGVTAVRFDPGGACLASASKDGTVRLWRAPRR